MGLIRKAAPESHLGDGNIRLFKEFFGSGQPCKLQTVAGSMSRAFFERPGEMTS
jgi:hypothetical protein